MEKLNEIQIERAQFNLPSDPVNDQEYITEDYLEKKLKYELITKKFQKTQEQLKIIDTCKLFCQHSIRAHLSELVCEKASIAEVER